LNTQSLGNAPAAPRSSLRVIQQLFETYYRDGHAHAHGASSHWSDFSRRFRVALNADGSIAALQGYGFGESGRHALRTHVFSGLGNFAHQRLLDAPGLQQELARARVVVSRMGLQFSQDAFRQACTTWLLGRHDVRAPGRIMVIGDGHGVLSGLLHERYPEAQLWLVDLGPTLLFQAAHLGRAFGAASHCLADEDEAPRAHFVYCPADRLGDLPVVPVALALNIASMQEMTVPAIASYFDFLRARDTQLFYCCNRVEKRLPGGEVLRFMDYPWRAGDKHLVDEACPWHQWFVGLGGPPNVRVAGVPVPLVHRYDGPTWHRLSRLEQRGRSTG
jgi:hypothetical protein